MPNGFNAIDDELLTVLDGLQVTVSSSATADSQTVDLSVKTPVYGNAAITLTVSKSSSNEILAVPSNVIDFNGDMDSDTQKKFEEFEQEVEDALKKIDIFKDYIEEIEPSGSVPVTPTTPEIPSTITPGVSHANDDFSTMTPDELEELVDEYTTRLYGTLYYFADNQALGEKWDEADEAYDVMYDYYWDYVYMEKTDEATLNNWRNGVRNFVILVEQCEALNA